MELADLRAFLDVLDNEGFRRAARVCRVPQPSLTRRVRDLECELGVTLFDRSKRPIRLTTGGRALAPRARALLAAAAETADHVARSAMGDVHVSLGALQFLGDLALADLLTDFRAAHPHTEVRLWTGNTEKVLESLQEGKVHLGLVFVDEKKFSPRYHVETLHTEELVIVASPRSDLVTKPDLSWIDLSNESFISYHRGASMRKALTTAAAGSAFSPHIAFETDDMATALALVERDMGVALVPMTVATKHARRVTRLSIDMQPITRTLGILTDTLRYSSPQVDEFVQFTTDWFNSTYSAAGS